MRSFLLATILGVCLPACGSTDGGTGGSGGGAGTAGGAGAGGAAGMSGVGGTGGTAGSGGVGGVAGIGGVGGAGGMAGTGGMAGAGGMAGVGGAAGMSGAGGTGGTAGSGGMGGVAGAAGTGGVGGQGGASGMGGVPLLPDLTATVSEVQLEFDTTVPAADLLEGCASASSGIDILRFSGTTNNVGPADIVVGDPGCPDCDENPLAVCMDPNFICAPADGHGHGHYQNFASYELLDDAGENVVAVGHKQGFCLRDSVCSVGGRVFTCHFQGLSAGCSDVYEYTLGCQYIEITNVPAGNYMVRMTTDPLDLFEETNETNNAHAVPVIIPSR